MRRAVEEPIVRQHSGWLIPLGLFIAIAVLCAAFLLFYLRPSAYRSDQLSPTGTTGPVAVLVNGRRFDIPANYFAYAQDRAGGVRDQVALIALLPALEGFSDAEAALFAGDAPDSPVVYLRIHADANNLNEADRLTRIYMPYIADPEGAPGPFGLVQYAFRGDSGYRNDDLFVGVSTRGTVIFLCVRPAADVPSPNCLAIDRPVAAGVALSYRFKRDHLIRWRAIANGVDRLVAGFAAGAAQGP